MAEARKKILCIEDDHETAKLIAEELSGRGFYVVIAYDGRIGLAAILKGIPDLVLCDVGLPEMSGFELLAGLNDLQPRLNRVPFIFLTGWSSRFDELRGRRLGADDYVVKPIDFDILETIVRARLVSGIVRHKMPAALSKPDDRHAQALYRGVRGKAASKATAREQIVELVDAPTVNFDLDHAKPMPGTARETETEVKAAMDRLIKR